MHLKNKDIYESGFLSVIVVYQQQSKLQREVYSYITQVISAKGTQAALSKILNLFADFIYTDKHCYLTPTIHR